MKISELASRYDFTIVDTSILVPGKVTLRQRRNHADEVISTMEKYNVLTGIGVADELSTYISDHKPVLRGRSRSFYHALVKLRNMLNQRTIAVEGHPRYRHGVNREAKKMEKPGGIISPTDRRLVAASLEMADKHNTAMSSSDRRLCRLARSVPEGRPNLVPDIPLGIYVFVQGRLDFVDLKDY